ncbi:GYDIA family GHMP kinase [Bizionia myxarmorum]|uniref:GHMP kinase n=1 Tax=Bizionia myxarmorum TaxID=291186 RepID=A0A5D0RF60_9FLAO|nr:GYDIA family GHMP kinase [Bizionia myxarmorum]TYB79194.1 GHMP kinase [Bizionia myxarmorum]
MESFYSNGKLLLTGEYVVLDGAKALAVPTKYGQFLDVKATDSKSILWKSTGEKGSIWFEDTFTISEGTIISALQNNPISERLIQILETAKHLNPEFLNSGYDIESRLTFPKDWGLGSSSTLLNNIADWAKIDPYQLLDKTFGGSGYDMACAKHNTAITYQLINEKRHIQPIHFNPVFKDNLYFVYLNQKQNSRDGIASYRKTSKTNTLALSEISEITEQIIICKELSDFNSLIIQHESIISKLINQPTVKSRLFPDFNGELKSLGAWGGDFILASSSENPTAYFKAKGFHTILRYQDLIL